MVKFSRSVFYLFGCLVNYSAVRFSIYTVVWIRSYVQVRLNSHSVGPAAIPVEKCSNANFESSTETI